MHHVQLLHVIIVLIICQYLFYEDLTFVVPLDSVLRFLYFCLWFELKDFFFKLRLVSYWDLYFEELDYEKYVLMMLLMYVLRFLFIFEKQHFSILFESCHEKHLFKSILIHSLFWDQIYLELHVLVFILLILINHASFRLILNDFHK